MCNMCSVLLSSKKRAKLEIAGEIAGLIVLDSPGDISVNYGMMLTLDFSYLSSCLRVSTTRHVCKGARSCIMIVLRLRET